MIDDDKSDLKTGKGPVCKHFIFHGIEFEHYLAYYG